MLKKILSIIFLLLWGTLPGIPVLARTTLPDSTSEIGFDLAFKSDVGDSIVARVGNKVITAREFLASYEFGPAFAKREKNSKSVFLKYMIDEKLLALRGYSENLDTTERAKELLNAITGDISTDQMFMDDIFNKVKVSKKKIENGISEKQFSYQIKWIYAPNKQRLHLYTTILKTGIPFDSVFNIQLKIDSVTADTRTMQVDKFDLRWRNPQFASVVDTMKIGQVSNPVRGPDGYYIVKLVDTWKNMIVGEAEHEKEAKNVEFMLKKEKADKISNKFIHTMMMRHNPVIQGKAFDILRSYLGGYYLPKEEYNKWNLDVRLKKELKELKTKDYKNLALVRMNSDSVTISEFIHWFRPRDNYEKFNEESFNSFSASIESMIWEMVRDKYLVDLAYEKGYQNKNIIKQQANWWRDKIVYSIVRDRIANSVGLAIENPSSLKAENKQKLLKAKLLHAITSLREKYHVVINKKLLNSLKVQDSDDPRAIDFYIIKRGGIYTHPAYPTIDYRWQTWEK